MKKPIKIILIVLGSIVGLFILLFGILLALIYIPSPSYNPAVYEPVRPEYWPTQGFLATSPEEQGMDSSALVSMIHAYQKDHEKNPTNSIDSITIIRNGYIVADIYFNPLYPKDTLHIIHSCTKSIMSSLIGIAHHQGYIDSIDMPVIDFFKDKNLRITDEGIREVTVRDLLTMQTGIRSRDSYIYNWDGWFKLIASDDWVAHFFTLPMDVKPGTRFDYSNLASFMLSAIIYTTTGMDTLSYARKNLFNPLGIHDVYWETSPLGIGVGSARMWLKPHDMAKFGLLYLQKGLWEGQQIIPRDWVLDSVTPHAIPRNYVDILDENGKKDMDGSQVAWVSNKFLKHFADGYGYQWWLDKKGNYNALGTSGQYLIVAPKENLIVMVTNSSSDLGVFFPGKLFYEYIVPSIRSNEAISVNNTAYNELLALSGPPDLNLESTSVPELPEKAMDISGKTFLLEENRWNYNNFRLLFNPEKTYAEFSYTAKVSDAASIRVGLDGVYHFTDTDIGRFAAMGNWTSPNTFTIFSQQIGYSASTQFELTFNQDSIEITEISLTGSITFSGSSR